MDLKHCVHIAGRAPLAKLNVTSAKRVQGIMYDTVSEKMISGVLSRLPRRYQDYTFVDFGSGKGKVELLAPRLPFRKVIGLEFAQQLIAVA